MRTFLNLFICLITLSAVGQEEILNLQGLGFLGGVKNIENYSLTDNETQNIAIIIAQNKAFKGYLYNSEFQRITEGQTYHLQKKYKEIIGYSVKDSRYTLVFATEDRKKFGFVSLDLKDKQSKTAEIDFEFHDEEYFETIHFDNRMFMLSLNIYNKLILREFTQDFTFEKIAEFPINLGFDLSRALEDLITKGDFVKIDTRVPNKIERTSSKVKLYNQNGKVYITFDDGGGSTFVNTIDLTSLTLESNVFSYPTGKIEAFKNYNSFIYGDNLFHIASSRDEMIFQIKDLDNKVLKEYYVDQYSLISFKNSPIIQDGSTYTKGKRVLAGAKQFLRKITAGNIGISIHKEDDQYQITLGSHVILNSSGGGFSGIPGGAFPTGLSTLYVPSYNAAFASYGSYGRSMSVYINGLFDEEFNHIKNIAFKNNIFDRIKEYQDELKGNTAEDVFIYNGETYFSFWNSKKQEYNLIKF